MRNRLDQLSKGIFGAVGSLLGQALTQFEIPGEVKYADVLFWRDEASARKPEELGLIGRMLVAPCMIECFSRAPRKKEVVACMSKLVELHRYLERQPGVLAGRMLPQLWLVSAGYPGGAIRDLGFRPRDGGPAGFWTAPGEGYFTNLVVVQDVPVGRESLLLRLVGARKTLRGALRELQELEPEAWEVELALPMVLAFRVSVAQNPSKEAMEYMDEINALYARWKQETLAEGRKKGLKAGRRQGLKVGIEKGREEGREEGREVTLRHSLLTVYRARFGQELPALARALDAADVTALERWLPLFATGTSEDIARATRSKPL